MVTAVSSCQAMEQVPLTWAGSADFMQASLVLLFM
jgi:hypothetical protein